MLSEQNKLCNCCKRLLPRAMFCKSTKSKDGIHTQCRDCMKAYYEANKERIRNRQRENWVKYASSNKDYLIDRSKAYRAANKDKLNALRKTYVAENLPKVSAKTTVHSHVLTGRLEKQPCEICGNPVADAHHDDYAKPLDVRWLCRPHHRAWHLENGEGKNGKATDSRAD